MNVRSTDCCIRLGLIGVILGWAFNASVVFASSWEEFEKLEAQMEEASEAFFAALDAEAEGHAGQLPNDPRPAILTQMDGFVVKTGDSPDAVKMAFSTFFWSLDIDLSQAFERFDKLTKRFPDADELREVLPAVPELSSDSATASDWIRSLDRLAAISKEKDIQAEGLIAKGQILIAEKSMSQAKDAFVRALKVGASDDVTKLAKGFVYELEHLQAGMSAPDFETVSLDGKKVSLKSLRGKVVLLDFWATWCPGCVAEFPRLEEASKQLSGKPFEVLAISLDAEQRSVEFFLKVRPVPGIQTWEKGVDNPVGELYNVQSLPTWYLLDPHGVIRARDPQSGEIVDLVNDLLEQAKAVQAGE